MFTYGWWLWSVGRYIERNALRDASATVAFSYQLTQRFTAEFALRPLLREQPEETLAVLREWGTDESVGNHSRMGKRAAEPYDGVDHSPRNAERVSPAHRHHRTSRGDPEPDLLPLQEQTWAVRRGI